MPIPLGSDVELPVDIATSTMAIVGVRGSGKSFTAAVIAEGLIQARIPLVIIDPTGVWWGLRVHADGKREGLEIAIIGGDRGDVPLRPGMGDALGELVTRERLSCVIDISKMRTTEWRPLLLDFFTRLYSSNTRPLHLIIDEADVVSPQQARSGSSQALHDVVDDIVRRGRVKGIGCTLITQRPAVISKNVLSQIEVLIVMHLIAPQDHKAIEDWIRGHDTEGRRVEVLESLPTLKPGQAWIWSPTLALFKRINVRKRSTFDSSRTPKVGEEGRVARSFADVDASAFKALLAAGNNQAATGSTPNSKAANEVHRLQQQLVQLQRQADASIPRKHIEVVLDQLRALVGSVQGIATTVETMLRASGSAIAPPTADRAPTATGPAAQPQRPRVTVRATDRPAAVPTTDAVRPGRGRTPLTGGLTGPQQKVLEAARWWEAVGVTEPTRQQIAFIARYSVNSGSFRNTLGRLRSNGLIDYPSENLVQLTPAGKQRIPEHAPHRDEAALHEAVRAQLSTPQRRILDALLPLRGGALSRDELAERTGYHVTSGSWRNCLGRMRTLGVIEYPRPDSVCASPLLYLD